MYTAVILDGIVTGFISHSKDYFSDTYTLRPNPSEDQVKNNISVVELKNNDYFDVLYCFDYTVPLRSLLKENSTFIESLIIEYNNPLILNPLLPSRRFSAFVTWYKLVESGGEWDLKNENIWPKTIPNIEYYSQKFVFAFEEYYMTSEDLGNFLFGCTGHALGLPFWMIKGGSAAVGKLEGAPDDENDVDNFQKGYDYYEKI